MRATEVIDDPAAALAAIDPIRSRLLGELGTPASAAMLAGRMGMPRQKVNYHLKALEEHGLVREAETKKWGGLRERLMVASADAYLLSPQVLGSVAADPAREVDRLSASYLLALAGRVIREVGGLLRVSRKVNRTLPTLSVDTEIRFRTPAERAAFSTDLTQAINSLVARYHDVEAPDGRCHRIVLLGYPSPPSLPSRSVHDSSQG